MKPNYIITALFAIATIIITGCGTARLYSGVSGQGWDSTKPYGVQDVKPAFYPSLQTDVALVFESFSEPKHLPLAIFPLIDIPIAAVVDTALLPYDSYKRRKWKSPFSQKKSLAEIETEVCSD